MSVDGEGRILVAGTAGSQFQIARLTADGRVDRRFGHDGAVGTGWMIRGRSSRRFDGNGAVGEVLARPDGRILVAGMSNGNHAVLVQLLPDGRLDRTFHGDGVLFVALRAPYDWATARLRADGTALLVVSHNVGEVGTVVRGRLEVYAFARDGESVPSYGDGGRASVPFAAALGAPTVQLTPDGGLTVDVWSYFAETIPFRIDVAPDGRAGEPRALAGMPGVAASATSDGPVVQRRDAEGALDPAFGADGTIPVLAAGVATPVAAVDPAGAIVTAGVQNAPRVRGGGGRSSLLVERLTADGARVEGWGGAPVVLERHGEGQVEQVVADAGGRILVLVDRHRIPRRSARRHDAVVVRLTGD